VNARAAKYSVENYLRNIFVSTGIQIKSNLHFHHLLYAHGQVILLQDGEDADYMCRKLIGECHYWGLKINVRRNIYHQILMMIYILKDTKLKKS
jgi:hypothetical protein